MCKYIIKEIFTYLLTDLEISSAPLEPGNRGSQLEELADLLCGGISDS